MEKKKNNIICFDGKCNELLNYTFTILLLFLNKILCIMSRGLKWAIMVIWV